MIIILGATGHVGRRIAESLLSAGRRIRVVGRSFDRLKPLMAKGAEPYAGDIRDTDFLVKVMTGGTAVFSMIPPDPVAADLKDHQDVISKSIVKAIKLSGVKYVVNLSSVGAHLKIKAGPITGLHDHETRLDKISGIHIVHLRAGFFMENLLQSVEMMRKMRINGSALRADVRMPVIATKDIAAVATDLLKNLDFRRKKAVELLGQRDISMEEMTAIIGKTLGFSDLRYVQFAYDEAEKGMIGSGLSPSVARAYVEMSRGFNDGVLQRGLERTPANTTPTSFEDFMEDFRIVYCLDNPECQAVGL